MEDNRFLSIKNLKKKQVPHQLHWFMKEDIFSNELLGLFSAEVNTYKRVAQQSFGLFEQATLGFLDSFTTSELPSKMQQLIRFSWENRERHPFIFGRFDITGGLDGLEAKTIEFNADTCTLLPETILWQKQQLNELQGKTQFNDLQEALVKQFRLLKSKLGVNDPIFLATSLGYEEDRINCNLILDAAHQAGFTPHYADLPEVIFADDGVFLQMGGEYEPIDVLFKMFPWDWIWNHEPDLLNDMAGLIMANKLTVLNPPYAALWQNKKMMAYITENHPNNVIAKTYLSPMGSSDWVEKPIYGRIGENITLSNGGKLVASKGDFADQPKIYQELLELPKDSENYYYQPGIFYADAPVSLGIRAEDSPIITDEAEFMSHYII